MSVRRHVWDDLSGAARAAVEERCGTVLEVEPAERGLMPGVAARLYTDGWGSVFLKGIPADDHAVRPYLRERAANLALAPSVPAPRMLWSGDAGGWVLLLFEFIEGARNADLSPDSSDLPGVLDALSQLGGAGGALPSVAVNLEMLQERAATLVARKLDGPQWGMYAEAIAALSVGSLEGETLLHYDLHAGNLLSDGREIYVIDWSFACRGQAWIDAALFVPRLIAAGHTPAQAEALVAVHPGWKAAPADVVTGLGALWTMFREYGSLYGPREARGFRARAAQAGRTWVAFRAR
ncbi:phosphotransferase family protein [Actinomadura sp. 1N219]|uniref:phosphotransferase family protein n=1 Tax=Actinomadura sp. 1N219 TaxID=3375152 RepID=UPI00378FD40B